MAISDTQPRSDHERDANKYYKLLLTLQSLADRATPGYGYDIDELLADLLPELIKVFDAEMAFVAVKSEEADHDFSLVTVSPENHFGSRKSFASKNLELVLADNSPHIFRSFDVFHDDQKLEVILAPMTILSQTRLIGMCRKYLPERGPFLAPDRQLLELLTKLISMGTRVGERRRYELDGLLRALSNIVSKLDLHQLYSTITEEAVNLFQANGVSGVSLLWRDNTDENLIVQAAVDMPKNYQDQHIIPCDSVEFQTDLESTTEPILIADPQSELLGPIALNQHKYFSAVWIAPLRINDKLMGTLNLYHEAGESAFSPFDLGLINAFAAQVTTSIQNAQLHYVTQQHAKRLDKLLVASRQITELQPAYEEYQKLVDGLSWGFDNVVLYPYDPYLHEFKAPLYPKANPLGQLTWPTGPDSILRKLMQGGPSYIFSTETHDPEWLKPFTISGYEAAIIRLQINSEVSGAIIIQQAQPHIFTADEKRLIKEVTHRTIQPTYKTLILKAIVDNLREAMDADVVTLYPFDANSNVSQQPLVAGELKSQHTLVRADRTSVVGKIIGGEISSFFTDTEQSSLAGEFSRREGIKSSGYALLRIDQEVVGVVFVNLRHRHKWTTEEIAAVELFSAQASIALRNAQLFERLEKRMQHAQAVYEASKAITAGNRARKADNEPQVFERMLEQVVRRVTGIQGSPATLGAIQRYYPDTQRLVLESVYPSDCIDNPEIQLGYQVSMTSASARIGIAGRAVKTGMPQLVNDVSIDDDYIPYSSGTRSELDVPLIKDGEVLGVLGVESDRPKAFDEDDVRALESVAELAIIALDNAERTEQLSRTNMIAIMEAWKIDPLRNVNREVGAIRDEVFTITNAVDVTDEIREAAEHIDRYVKALIVDDDPLTTDENLDLIEPLILGKEIDAALATLENDHRFKGEFNQIQFSTRGIKRDAEIIMPESRLQFVLNQLLTNAIRAIQEDTDDDGNKRKEIYYIDLNSTIVDYNKRLIEIRVEDTGKGVRQEIQPELFKWPIAHIGKREKARHGHGLLLSSVYVEQAGGCLRLEKSQPGQGAQFAFTVRLAEKNNISED